MNQQNNSTEPLEIKKKNVIFLLSKKYKNNKNKLANSKSSFFLTVSNNIKFCSYIIDFELNKLKNKNEFIDLPLNNAKYLKKLYFKIVKMFDLENINLSSCKLTAFSRYLFNYFYIDHLLLQNENYDYLITSVHLAQFAEFDEIPNYKFVTKFHKNWMKNLKISKKFQINEINFSPLYGKSNIIGTISISIGCIIILLSIFALTDFWGIIFGIFAIIIGILWFFPI